MKTELRKSLAQFASQPVARLIPLPASARSIRRGLWCWGLALLLALTIPQARAHIVLPEKLHPVAESYRRVSFILNVIPVAWDQVDPEIVALADYWRAIDAPAADNFLKEARAIIAKATIKPDPEKELNRCPGGRRPLRSSNSARGSFRCWCAII